jgi:thioredoxin 1
MLSAKRLTQTMVLALTSVLFWSQPGWAQEQEREPFSETRFQELQGEDALILVDVYADWCPTCAAQQEVLASFRKEHPDVPLHVLRVDFDKQKEWVRHFGAPRQSTFILYRGEERVWFAVAETRQEEVFKHILAAAGQE